MILWQKIALLSVLGIAGTLARYWMQGWVQSFSPNMFPWGTLAVNVLGCFLFGVVSQAVKVSPEMRVVLLSGFMGAFTTFSTFAFETTNFLQHGQWLLAFGNFFLQNTLGVAAVLLGMAVGG